MRAYDSRREPAPEDLVPIDGADLASLAAAYRAEQDRLLAQRLPITAGIYLVMVGIAIGVEWILFPQRRGSVVGFYGLHVFVSGFWLALAVFRPARLSASIRLHTMRCAEGRCRRGRR